jgi:hypothetical protein
MPTVKSTDIQINKEIVGTKDDPILTIEIDATNPMKSGQYRFQLVVVDDAGNKSGPALLTVTIVDDQLPTARITGPETVSFNAGFTLSGQGSTDAGGGVITQYIWTLVG